MRKKVIILMVVCCIGLTGCDNSNSKELKKLNQQITELKTENEELKKRIAENIIESSSLGNNIDVTAPTTSNNDEKTDNEKIDYINNSLSLDSAKVSICEGYLGKEPGIENISIKNNGDKNIDKLTVTVYFQDESGKNIAENSFLVIGDRYENAGTLKANYSWKMEEDKYYPIKNISDEVDITRNRVEISDIEFGE